MILSCKTYFLIFVLFKTLKNNIFYSVVHMHWTVAERTPQAGYNIFAWKLVVASGKTVLVQMVVNSAWWINVVNVLWPSTVWVHLKSTLAEIRQRPKGSLMTECHISYFTEATSNRQKLDGCSKPIYQYLTVAILLPRFPVDSGCNFCYSILCWHDHFIWHWKVTLYTKYFTLRPGMVFVVR